MACSKVIERKKCPKSEHKCGERRCKSCKKFFPPGHLCFLNKVEPKKHNDKLIFFDFETTQATGEHIVNYAILQYADGNTKKFEGVNTLTDFCNYVFTPIHKGYTLLAHNMKGFDGQFVLKWLLEKGYQPKVIPQGSKIIQILVTALSIRFIDSYSFFPMSLSKLPKTFGKNELAKGFFPHLFNTPENQNYVGTIPDQSFYTPEMMSKDTRQKFLSWYEEQKDDVFDFRKEMEKYCLLVLF
uniref:DNA-directed DNA polymerase n=1 Tax=Parasteatoda tepidariorum TaxID=114398 RepID=A0A2L2YSB0_PARTP